LEWLVSKTQILAEAEYNVNAILLGSGKTTFMQRINSHLHGKSDPPYVINLDPAVRSVPFDSNIDIRDSVNYKEVMKQYVHLHIRLQPRSNTTALRYNLGPNGGILTSLNLFATKIDQILTILEKRTKPDTTAPPTTRPIKHILVDTPGQIEVFVWSASGSILLDSLASSFPTVLAYIIDTPRTSSTSTFMSNMLYACSILYKTKLPMILVFNKTDVQDASFAQEWMTDFEAFQAALRSEEEAGSFGGVEGGESGLGGGSGYMGSLLNSMSLMLEEFYRHLSVIGVSSMTGAGIDAFFQAVSDKAAEFTRDYVPELERRRAAKEAEKEKRRQRELARLMKDVSVSGGQAAGPKRREPETLSDSEDEGDIDAQMVEPDEYDSEHKNNDEGGERGANSNANLTSRYKKALEQESGPSQSVDDSSFVRYIRASNING
jgi:GPN-loop GTPase